MPATAVRQIFNRQHAAVDRVGAFQANAIGERLSTNISITGRIPLIEDRSPCDPSFPTSRLSTMNMKTKSTSARIIPVALLAASLSALAFTGCTKHDRDQTSDKVKDAYQDTKDAMSNG